MNILFIGGDVEGLPYLSGMHNRNIVNKQTLHTSQIIEVVSGKDVRFDALVILDYGINETLSSLEERLNEFKKIYPDKEIIIFTNDLEVKFKFSRYNVEFLNKVRITKSDYERFLNTLNDHCKDIMREETIYEEVDEYHTLLWENKISQDYM